MTPARLETLVWVCIYGGLATLMLGGWTRGTAPALGIGLAIAGGLLLLAGLLLIWLRSRLRGGARHDGKAGKA